MRALLELSRGGREQCGASDTLRPLRGGAAVKRGSRYLLLALIAVTVIILDQATKYWITQSMRLHESIPLIPNLFSFTYIRNPGAAFGLLAGSSNAFRTVFFGVTSLFALALLERFWCDCPKGIGLGKSASPESSEEPSEI